MDEFKFSLQQAPQQPQQQTNALPAEPQHATVPDAANHVDMLNQHVLLTVQNLNQLRAAFTVRGA
jgi:hypothetical protein